MSHSDFNLQRYPLWQTMIPRPRGGQKTGSFAAFTAAKLPVFLFVLPVIDQK
jgi:hypothetical protein